MFLFKKYIHEAMGFAQKWKEMQKPEESENNGEDIGPTEQDEY